MPSTPPAPAATPHRDESPGYVLPVEGFKGTPAEIERQWFERCYRGRGDSMLQLTWRAVLMGSLLGGILSLTNLYIGLKSGWGFGVAITACILSYAIWTTLHSLRIVRTPMTILENNCMQSTASAAGYSTGGTLVSAVAAYIIVNNQTLDTWTLMAWVFFLAVLGVTMAIPMKRQMINVEQLRFPSGIAAAETLRALHATGAGGLRSALALGAAGALAVFSKLWNEGLSLFSPALTPYQISTWLEALNTKLLGAAWIGRTVTLSWDPLFIAAGAITGMRVCASMLLGGITCWMLFIPQIQARGLVEGDGYRALVQWPVWGGAACMVTSGLLSFGLQWRTALRAFGDLAKMFVPRRTGARDDLAAIETPGSWFLAGQLVGTLGLAYLAQTTFGMPYWLTVLAVLLSFALAIVACRVCGETDTTPVGAMGKITQLTFGTITRGQNINLMSACITAGAADSSSDLLIDLKSGYLLGANPRKQFLAQFAGIFMGAVASVLGFKAVVTGAAVLGTEQFPAPSAQTWAAVAQAMSEGLASLHPLKLYTMAIGGGVGILLPLLERWLPKYRAFIPSAAGLGLAWTFPFFQAEMFFLGALVGWLVEKTARKASDEFLFPVASGIIAGDSLTGVTLVFIQNGPEIWRQLMP
jgi:uncharacterized oligopeptide transporter (OPT) family protein